MYIPKYFAIHLSIYNRWIYFRVWRFCLELYDYNKDDSITNEAMIIPYLC